jgi:two-component system response regulator AtoC
VPHTLIVEDDTNSAEMLAELLATEGHSTAVVSSLHDARRQLLFRMPDIVLLDLNLPDGSGIDLFDSVDRAACEVVLITGQASVETSVQALRLGAADYLIKPLDVRRLRAVLARLAPPAGEAPAPRVHQDAIASEGRFGRLWGRSAPMREVYRQIDRVAPTAVTALITGESGTGKELVAQTIHEASRRAGGPFLAVNCGAISPQLIESELFGHERGSFTGAVRQHRGFFERADGGTLFLDEVTEMPVELQVKLLRVLETGSFTPVGADQPRATDVRIVAATNRNPTEAVAEGLLREDLYYRLAVFPIELPPLRERREDIPLIAQHFLSALNAREGSGKRFTNAALAGLQACAWPGNVRELRNAVHRGFILAEGDHIDADCVPLDAQAMASVPDALPVDALRTDAVRADDESIAEAGGEKHAERPEPPRRIREIGQTGQIGPHEQIGRSAQIGQPGEATTSSLDMAVGMTIAEVERRLILATLEHCGGHRERAAVMLGISARTLYNRMKHYEVKPPSR